MGDALCVRPIGETVTQPSTRRPSCRRQPGAAVRAIAFVRPPASAPRSPWRPGARERLHRRGRVLLAPTDRQPRRLSKISSRLAPMQCPASVRRRRGVNGPAERLPIGDEQGQEPAAESDMLGRIRGTSAVPWRSQWQRFWAGSGCLPTEGSADRLAVEATGVGGSGPTVWCVEAQDPYRSRPASVKRVWHSVGDRDERPWADGLCRTGERRLNGSAEDQEGVDLAALIA